MGSFTPSTANVIMAAVFPQTTTAMTPATTVTTQAGFKIYNSTNAANNIGIYCPHAANVLHRIDLLVGSVITGTSPSSGGGAILDTQFGYSALTNVTNFSTNTITFPTFGAGQQYVGYRGTVMGDATTVPANAWTGWFLGTNAQGGTLPAATNNNQITFPTSGTGSSSCQVQGFVITAANLPTTNNTGLTTTQPYAAPTSTIQPVFIAYGDLNTYRTVSANDTPVFTGGAGTTGQPQGTITTNGAIVITLD